MCVCMRVVCYVLCERLECLTPHPVKQKTHRWRRWRQREGEEKDLFFYFKSCFQFVSLLLVRVAIRSFNCFIVCLSHHEARLPLSLKHQVFQTLALLTGTAVSHNIKATDKK